MGPVVDDRVNLARAHDRIEGLEELVEEQREALAIAEANDKQAAAALEKALNELDAARAKLAEFAHELAETTKALELQKRIGSGFSSALLPCEEAIADAAELFERWLERDGWPQGDDPLTDESRAWLKAARKR